MEGQDRVLKPGDAINWFVGQDGSEESNHAIDFAMELLEKNDTFTIGHAYNRKKEETIKDWKYKLEVISEYAQPRVIGLGARGKFVWKDIESNTKDTVNALAKENKADIMVVGFHGRKGVKEDVSICGSQVIHLSETSVMPILIVEDKKTKKERGGKLKWAVMMDGSAKSYKTMEKTFAFMDRSTDSIVTITCDDGRVNKDAI
jgi:nucleotide-binding universal stress UspA family protein